MRKLLIILGVVAALGAGAGAQQSNVTNAVVIAALQAMGLFGDGYAAGDVPTWSVAASQYVPSSGSGATITSGRFIAAATATCAAPQFTVTGALTTGIAVTTTPSVLTCVGGSTQFTVNSTGDALAARDVVAARFVQIQSDTGALLMGTANDLGAHREAANYWFQRNSANAQRASWANTYTSATNYEAFSVDWQTAANVALVGTRTAATGTGRIIRFVAQADNAADQFAFISLQPTALPVVTLGYGGAGGVGGAFPNAGTWFSLGNVTSTATSGTVVNTAITPTYNQTSGTAANTDLLINRTETAVGSGTQLLIDAQVGGVSLFNVSNNGNVVGGLFAIPGGGNFQAASPFVIRTAPSGPVACTSPAVSWNNGTAAFQIDVGTSCGTSVLSVTMPAAANAWQCVATNATTSVTAAVEMTASTSTSITLTNYTRTTGAALNWADGADVRIACWGG